MEVKKIKRYLQYKDSGIKWLADIPEHWEIKPGFIVVEERNEKNRDLRENTVLSLSYGNIIIKSEDKLTGLVPESFETYQIVYPNDIIIRPTDLQNDKVSLRTGFSQHKGIITSAYINLKVKDEFYPYYVYLFLYTIDITKIIYGLGSGLRQNLSFLDLKRFPFPIPPLSEQKSIADYLDKKTEQIDKAIVQKEQMIELLKERKQILINRAVTRGLNPDVPLKDSSIDWIGQIPVHWEVRKLKYIAKLKSGETITSDEFIKDGAFPVYGGNGLRGYTNKGFTNEGLYVLIGRQGALCGNINYAKDQFWASEHAVVVYPNIGYKIKWLGETLRVMDLNQYSQSAAQPGIAVEKIVNLSLPLPSIKEQKEIVSHIERNTEKIDKAIFLKQEEIEKLKEYKSTLIDSAVTGKICLMN